MAYLPANFGAPVNPTQQTQQPIGGQLPFQPGGNPFSQDLGTAYQSSYNNALQQNQSNYTNILKGYQDTLAQQTSAQNAIGKGYSGLYNNVLSGIQGIGQSQAQAISDEYARAQGQGQQDLINRGLGNSTVLSSVQRGNQFDKSKADIALANQIAQLTAGYQSQLGGAGLNFANQANMQNAAQQNAQLGWMNSVSAPYPNAQMYAQLLQQQGITGQADKDRALAAQLAGQQLKTAQQAQGRAGGGGSLAPNYPAAPSLGPMSPGGVGGYAGNLASITPFGMNEPNFGGMANPNFGGGQGTAALAAGFGGVGAAVFGGAPPPTWGTGGSFGGPTAQAPGSFGADAYGFGGDFGGSGGGFGDLADFEGSGGGY